MLLDPLPLERDVIYGRPQVPTFVLFLKDGSFLYNCIVL